MSGHTMMLVTSKLSPIPEPRSHQSGDCGGEPTMTTTRVLGKQAIFRVKDIRSSTAKVSLNQKPIHHARRPHCKSRTGCANCKRRRVKVKTLITLDAVDVRFI